jgi:hydrogenase expression/formation protein HypC
MCLGIPMRLIERNGNQAVAELSGVRREVMLDLCPEAEIGEYVIIHAGYAIQRMGETEAQEVLDLLKEYLKDEGFGADGPAGPPT